MNNRTFEIIGVLEDDLEEIFYGISISKWTEKLNDLGMLYNTKYDLKMQDVKISICHIKQYDIFDKNHPLRRVRSSRRVTATA